MLTRENVPEGLYLDGSNFRLYLPCSLESKHVYFFGAKKFNPSITDSSNFKSVLGDLLSCEGLNLIDAFTLTRVEKELFQFF